MIDVTVIRYRVRQHDLLWLALCAAYGCAQYLVLLLDGLHGLLHSLCIEFARDGHHTGNVLPARFGIQTFHQPETFLNAGQGNPHA